jgi:hypothetical protein
MPVIPSDWTGQQTITTNLNGGGNPVYQFVKSNQITIIELDTFIDLIGVCNESISREVSLDLITGSIKLYWKGLDNSYTQIQKDNLIFDAGYNFVDFTLGQLGLSIKCSEVTELFLVIRWDKEIDFLIYSQKVTTGDDLMIPIDVRLAVGTGLNYMDIDKAPYPVYDEGMSIYSYDTGELNQGSISNYATNLRKLKDSDSYPVTTGWKLFDIECFYPGKIIDFDVIIDPTVVSKYGSIHIQLLDPLTVGEVLFAMANDIINIEVGSLSDNFVGALTRNAWYKDVINNKVNIKPTFSHHVGRFVAQNINKRSAFDTAIIKSYTPNLDPLLGGRFTLTGEF